MGGGWVVESDFSVKLELQAEQYWPLLKLSTVTRASIRLEIILFRIVDGGWSYSENKASQPS